jgi:tetratricopeptide (TPR) repeat protein
MNKFSILGLTVLFFVGCSNAPQQQQTPTTANTNSSIAQKPNDTAVVSSHSNDAGKATTAAPHSNKTSAPNDNNSSSGSSPMSKAVDVSQMTADIEKAQKEYGKDPKNKDVLAKAYFTRAFALTEAAQYRSALGDFRKGLKLNPNDQDAKKMHDEILRIFQSINREPPKEGEEPPPMPITKGE